jgi:DNA-binding NtrC family response regulator
MVYGLSTRSWQNPQLPAGIFVWSRMETHDMTIQLFEAAQAETCVLLTGCTCARSVAFRIHDLSSQHAGRFVAVDCSGTEQEIEEQLFQRLTGPEQPRVSTLFVEEVGKLNLAQQRRLVEALDRPMSGGSYAWTRVIACSSEWLLDRVLTGTFDDRLFYRLNAIHLHLHEVDEAADHHGEMVEDFIHRHDATQKVS